MPPRIRAAETVIQAEPHHIGFEFGALCHQLIEIG
jgi:hypothetical protein